MLKRGAPARALSGGREFLDYAGFCDYVRPLQFSSVRQYKDWVHTDARPPTVPVCPHIMYKNTGWTSWTKALGYEREKHYNRFREVRDLQRSRTMTRSRGATTNGIALQQFCDAIKSKSGDYDFLWLRGGRLGLLFRQREAVADKWCAIQVRTAEVRRESVHKKMEFRFHDVGLAGRGTEIGVLTACAKEGKMQLQSYSDIEREASHRTRFYLWLPELRAVNVSEMLGTLDEMWSTLPRLPSAHWINLSLQNTRLRLSAVLLSQVVQHLYIPSALELRFVCHRGDFNSYDAIVGSARMIHRTACLLPGDSGKVKVKLTHPVTTDANVLESFTLDRSDPFDFLTVFVREGDLLVGLFLLPKSALDAAGVLSRSRAGGQSCVVLSPPGSRPTLPKIAKVVPDEEKFYIDVATENAAPARKAEAVNQFKRIMQEFGSDLAQLASADSREDSNPASTFISE
ncbi:unnamed protein product [Amoebophrya sp. A120]|nr:unnamed protein product [Amoebophrya sp. A120]|eukprot:GSA120T00007415001.1